MRGGGRGRGRGSGGDGDWWGEGGRGASFLNLYTSSACRVFETRMLFSLSIHMGKQACGVEVGEGVVV